MSEQTQLASSSRTSAEQRQTFLSMFARGYFPGRSGQLMIVPREGVILTRRDPAVPFMHGSPWQYDTHVPLLLYGRRSIRPGRYDLPARHQDVAPTMARLLGMSRAATMSGRALDVALVDGAARPRVVVLAVLDGMRADYFDTHASRLPTLGRLRAEGAWFGDTRIDYLPSNTAVGHTTIVTGADPRVHGITGNNLLLRGHGRRDTYTGLSPEGLMALTIADLWKTETDGRAIVVAQGSSAQAATPLAGHGACVLNGWPVFLAAYDRQRGEWETNPACYTIVPAIKTLTVRGAVELTGTEWRGRSIASPGTFRRTPFLSAFEGSALLAALDALPVGEDEVPDLILVNLKAIDYVGHQYGPDSPELEETLESLDRQIARLTAALEARVGAGGYALAITADHGMPAEPRSDGRILSDDLVALLHGRFDPQQKALITYYEPENSQIFVDKMRLKELGLTLAELQQYLEAQAFIFAAYTEDEVRAVGHGLENWPVRL